MGIEIAYFVTNLLKCLNISVKNVPPVSFDLGGSHTGQSCELKESPAILHFTLWGELGTHDCVWHEKMMKRALTNLGSKPHVLSFNTDGHLSCAFATQIGVVQDLASEGRQACGGTVAAWTLLSLL